MKSVESLAERAAEIYEDPPEEVYSVPLNHPFPYPRIYLPFDIGEAAHDAMAEEGIYVGDLSNLEILYQTIDATKELIPHWEQASKHRKVVAFLLNNFSGVGEFNAN